MGNLVTCHSSLKSQLIVQATNVNSFIQMLNFRRNEHCPSILLCDTVFRKNVLALTIPDPGKGRAVRERNGSLELTFMTLR